MCYYSLMETKRLSSDIVAAGLALFMFLFFGIIPALVIGGYWAYTKFVDLTTSD